MARIIRNTPCSLFRVDASSGMLSLPLSLLLSLHAADSTHFVRVNQVGYLPDAPKVAVVCSLDGTTVGRFRVEDERGRVVLRERRAVTGGPLGPCRATERLDFSAVRAPGRYVIVAGDA